MRTITNATRNSFQSRANTELLLMFAEITHPTLDAPIRIVTEDINGISYQNGLAINYKWDGGYGGPLLLFQACPFAPTLLSDDDNPPRAQIHVANANRKIGLAVMALTVSPLIRLSGLILSDFSSSLDSDNARTPIGTPSVWYDAKYLLLRNVSGDDSLVKGDIMPYDPTTEPCPPIRTTQDRTPGLYL